MIVIIHRRTSKNYTITCQQITCLFYVILAKPSGAILLINASCAYSPFYCPYRTMLASYSSLLRLVRNTPSNVTYNTCAEATSSCALPLLTGPPPTLLYHHAATCQQPCQVSSPHKPSRATCGVVVTANGILTTSSTEFTSMAMNPLITPGLQLSMSRPVALSTPARSASGRASTSTASYLDT